MKRITMTFLVLAATGGCMAVDRDPMDVYDPPRRPAAQPWAPPSGQAYGSGWDGRYQPPSTSWKGPNNSTTGTASNAYSYATGQTSSTGNKSTSSTSSTTAVAAKPSAKTKTTPAKKEDKAVVQTKFTSDDDTVSATTSKKSSSPPKIAPEATAKAPPVNLGVLRLLNSKRITFRYEVKDPASAGVAGLELWGTTDQKSWKKYDVVTRTPSSLVVDVKEEGLYGFSMIARGKSEVTKNQPPQPGEPPQVWVAVDLTKPVVQLLGAELNVLSATPSLVVRWSAKDRNLGARPISLLYAEHLEGPWSAISASVENNGKYEWVMPPCVPAKIYVRVQATDMMGNVGMAQTATLHIPGRSSVSAGSSMPSLAEPPRLTTVRATTETQLHPVAAAVPNPAVSILSVDPD
jgi:hypothetical protein